MRRFVLLLLITAALIAAVLTGCGGDYDEVTEAVETSAQAAIWWAVEGCTANGCKPPYVCNKKTKLCEPAKCEPDCEPPYTCNQKSKQCELAECESDLGCSPGYHCDLKSHRCE
jgi:hypothetical protein